MPEKPETYKIPLLATLTAFFAVSSVSAADAENRKRQYFKDYMATCYPDSRCELIAFKQVPNLDDPRSPGAYHHLAFFADANAEGNDWSFSMATIIDRIAPETDVTFTIDNHDWIFRANNDYTSNFGDFRLLASERANDFLNAMISGNRISVTYTDHSMRKRKIKHSIRGVASALKWASAHRGMSQQDPGIVPFTSAQ